MDIQITARHSKVSSSLKDAISQKLSKIEKFHEKITSCHIVLDAEGTDKTAEIIVVALGHTFTSKAKAENLGKAIDDAVSKSERQLKKSNQKIKNHKTVKPTTVEPVLEEEEQEQI